MGDFSSSMKLVNENQIKIIKLKTEWKLLKLITLQIYLNGNWAEQNGRLHRELDNTIEWEIQFRDFQIYIYIYIFHHHPQKIIYFTELKIPFIKQYFSDIYIF